MTNREAIEILSRPLFMDGTPKEILDAHRMAISALEFRENYDKFWEEVKTAGKRGKETIPHRNYQCLPDYWCECGWHLGKKGDVKFCADCGRRIKWD